MLLVGVVARLPVPVKKEWSMERSRSGSTLSRPGIASITGAYTNESPRYLQTTDFLLDPDGKILNAVYSSGAIGRLVAEDVIGMVKYLKSKS